MMTVMKAVYLAFVYHQESENRHDLSFVWIYQPALATVRLGYTQSELANMAALDPPERLRTSASPTATECEADI